MDINDIQAIMQILKEHDITDFELEHNGTHLKVSRGQMLQTLAAPLSAQVTRIEPAIVGAHGANGQAVNSDTKAEAKANSIPSNYKKVESPIVGTFYRKSSPEAQAFVKEGDRVKKGQTVCIIEAMKVMNEIESTADGTVEKILPGDGEVVEYGEVLFLINPQG